LSDYMGDSHHGVYIDQPGGGEARIPMNNAQRFGLAQHHTATHLLHEGLRNIVGAQVQQAGSLVDVNRLRFDFTYNKAVTPDQLLAIETAVNNWIRTAQAVVVSDEPIADAKARGAHAMFGEKYGETVRVVDIPGVSLELCGGNHVTNTRDLQSFKITSESAVAAGTRRIEAVVGEQRVAHVIEMDRKKVYGEYKKRWDALHKKAVGMDVSMPDLLPKTALISDVIPATNALIKHAKIIEKQLIQTQQSAASTLFDDVIQSPVPLKLGHGVAVFKVIESQPVPVLRDLADRVVNTLGDCAVVLVSGDAAKGHAIAKVSPNVMNHISAKSLIQDLTEITGGGGGGRDAMAQAGGIGVQRAHEGVAFIHKKYATITGD
ncbi:MAG: DHHA1 domain-containing protein, partial [Candidatus Marinamargulisbacteria bacterium]